MCQIITINKTQTVTLSSSHTVLCFSPTSFPLEYKLLQNKSMLFILTTLHKLYSTPTQYVINTYLSNQLVFPTSIPTKKLKLTKFSMSIHNQSINGSHQFTFTLALNHLPHSVCSLIFFVLQIIYLQINLHLSSKSCLSQFYLLHYPISSKVQTLILCPALNL